MQKNLFSKVSGYLYLKKLGIPEAYYFVLLGFALLNILLINTIFLSYITPFASDSEGYLEIAKYFRGYTINLFYVPRLLKPLVPFLASLSSYIFNFKPAFLFVNSIFYLLIGFVIYKIIKLMFSNDRQALIGSLLFLSSYPMLEYGIAYMTDLAGWFFFALCVYLTLLFLKQPSYRWITWGALVSSFGFLTKEYAAAGCLFFAICLFFINKGSFLNKIKYLAVYLIIFLIPFGAWQLFVFFKFNYSYLNWWVNNHGTNNFGYERDFIKLVIKSLAATFLLGWAFVLAGIVKIKKVSPDNRKILMALILPSFSFLLWPAASSRLFFVIGPLLTILASWGIVSWGASLKKKYLYFGSLAAVTLFNYFWFVFGNQLRVILNSLLNIRY